MIEENMPIIRLGERCLLVSKEPTMAIGGMNDIEVTPLQRTRWRSYWDRGSPLHVFMNMSIFVVRASQSSGREQSEDDARRKQHGS